MGTFAGFDSRVSFLIDSQGHIAKVYEDVDPGVHAKEVLADVSTLKLVPEAAPVGAPAEAAPTPSATP